jgi:hypothetical protein
MVYRARERRSRNRVVLKLYAAATTAGARAVARDKEQRVHELLAGVPGLVSVRSVVVTGEGTYMVMDACNGEWQRQWMGLTQACMVHLNMFGGVDSRVHNTPLPPPPPHRLLCRLG